MFGLSDHNQQSNDDPAMLDNVKQLAGQPADQVAPAPVSSTNTATTDQSDDGTKSPEPLHGFNMDDPSQISDSPSTSSQTQPAADEPTQSPLQSDSPSNAGMVHDTSTPDAGQSSDDSNQPSQDTPAQVEQPSSLPPVDPAHLAGLKQQALEHLEPITEHIDGTPEERFKTTMMMIQANDNHTLLEKALEAARAIEDDKVRAQAMLDIINEINYFSQDNNEQ